MIHPYKAGQADADVFMLRSNHSRFWTLTAEESTLLPGMTDKGRLGFATQLKFIDIHGRFPEHHNEIDPQAVQWLTTQIKVTPDLLGSYDFLCRQSR